MLGNYNTFQFVFHIARLYVGIVTCRGMRAAGPVAARAGAGGWLERVMEGFPSPRRPTIADEDYFRTVNDTREQRGKRLYKGKPNNEIL